jgi:O-antigen/teichoic acid export membrane protein
MRVKNSVRNIIAGIIMQVVVMFLNFLSRAVFVRFLSIEYLGVNGLFGNILSMLNLAELGIGSIIIYSLYKPLAVDDKNKVASYVRFYKVSYNLIGFIILVVGMIITPFLHVFIKEMPDIPNLQYIYILFLLDTCSTYFLGYKSAILQADQKKYILATVTLLQQVASNIAMIIILITTRNFILFLVIRVLIHILQNIVIVYIVNKKYGYLKSFNSHIKLRKEDKKELFTNLRKVIVSKIGDYCVLSTDNLIISYFLGVYPVGLLSNYVLIMNAVSGLIIQVFDGITPSFGNLIVTETAAKKYSVFKIIMFLNFWISGFSTICLYILINPFISLWIGEKYTLEPKIVSLLVLNFFILGMRTSINIPRNTSGLFTKDSYASLVEATVNLVISIFLVKRIGIAGVLIGTTISAVSVQFFTVPYFSYKFVFKQKLLQYYLHYFQYCIITIIALVTTQYLCNVLAMGTDIVIFIQKLTLCCILPNFIFFLIFRNTEEFIYLKKQINWLIKLLFQSK